jgi:GMP synthase-like glutamine amidotransferase
VRFLVLQHLDIEHPGIFRRYFGERGIVWDTVELDRGDAIPNDLTAYDALAVFGGPMDVWEENRYPWLITEKAAIRHWVRELKRPYLGVCLGHQLLADALGGAVSKMPAPEVGIADVDLTEAGKSDPLMKGIPLRTRVLEWHGAEVSALPPDSVILARNDTCTVQSFRAGQHAYGLQYHVEIESETVAEWNKVPAYAAALAQLLGPGGKALLEQRAQMEMPLLNELASTVCENFQSVVAGTVAAPPPIAF